MSTFPWGQSGVYVGFLGLGAWLTYQAYQEPQQGEVWSEETKQQQEIHKIIGYGIVAWSSIALILLLIQQRATPIDQKQNVSGDTPSSASSQSGDSVVKDRSASQPGLAGSYYYY